jgi:hypothetical protein
MKTIAIAVTVLALASPAFAAQTATPGETKDPMAGWVPRKVTKPAADKQEIMALFKTMEDAEKAGNLEAAAAMVDFPVLMVTDNSRGQAMSDVWTKEKWTQVMAPFYQHPNPDMKVTHKPSVFLITDSLASVQDEWTMTMKGKKLSARDATLLVRKDGKWLIKSMTEGGWGDLMAEHPSTASEGSAPSGTGASGAAGAGQPSGTGTGAAPSAPTEPQQAPQPTTK